MGNRCIFLILVDKPLFFRVKLPVEALPGGEVDVVVVNRVLLHLKRDPLVVEILEGPRDMQGNHDRGVVPVAKRVAKRHASSAAPAPLTSSGSACP